MTKHYVEFFYPEIFFSESSTKEIKSREGFDPKTAPKECFAYQFFDREETVIDGEKLTGKSKNVSGKHYFGELYDLDRVKREVPDSDILQSNMKNNGYAFMVKTRKGNFQPFEKKDKLV